MRVKLVHYGVNFVGVMHNKGLTCRAGCRRTLFVIAMVRQQNVLQLLQTRGRQTQLGSCLLHHHAAHGNVSEQTSLTGIGEADFRRNFADFADIVQQSTGNNKILIHAFNLRGPVNVQYLYDEDRDRYLLLEVNPRLASGVICSIRAGAPITDYIIGESLGIPLHPCDDWSDNTLMTRYWKEVTFYNS